MIKHLILFTIILALFVSCKNVKTPKAGAQNPGKSEISEAKSEAFNYFDWSKPTLLKEKTIFHLKEKNGSNDTIIIDFLTEYQKIVVEFNDIMYDLNNYDSLNTLAYSDDGNVYQCARDFLKKVEGNGLSIAYSEGMIYISQNTAFIKSQIQDLLDPVSTEFISLYCDEIDTVCCDDAALMISEKKLVNRIYNWGELLDKVSGLKYAEIAESEFYNNLNLLYQGQDNTPAFDWDSKKFNQNSLDNMKEIISQHPDSRAAKEFEVFIRTLEAENFENTGKVSEFLKGKFN